MGTEGIVRIWLGGRSGDEAGRSMNQGKQSRDGSGADWVGTGKSGSGTRESLAWVTTNNVAKSQCEAGDYIQLS